MKNKNNTNDIINMLDYFKLCTCTHFNNLTLSGIFLFLTDVREQSSLQEEFLLLEPLLEEKRIKYQSIKGY